MDCGVGWFGAEVEGNDVRAAWRGCRDCLARNCPSAFQRAHAEPERCQDTARALSLGCRELSLQLVET